MALFDSLISEAASKFGLGDKAGPLLKMLLSLITSNETGGITGFLDKFKTAGLGDLVTSWISSGANKTISTNQLESALGGNVISNIAEKVGLPSSLASSAMAFMLPGIIDKLTPSGVIPTSLPDTIKYYVGGALGAVTGMASGAAGSISDTASKVAGAAGAMGAGAMGAAAGMASGARDLADDAARSSGSMLWRVLPIAALALLAFIGYRACASQPPTMDESAKATPVTTPAMSSAATTTSPAASAAPLNPVEAVKEAGAKAAAALGALTANSSTEDLVKALNLNIINFASGASAIPKESEDILNKSAAAIKAAPKGTIIEVGGHTDNTGNAAGNQKLSQSRAEAVRAYLIKQGVNAAMLKAKGYGDTKPTATNDSDEGRFRNRRIEFTITK